MTSPITHYIVVRAMIQHDIHCHSTFALDVQTQIDLGYQPYGKPLMSIEHVTGFTAQQVVGYQTLVKYASCSKLIPNHPRPSGT